MSTYLLDANLLIALAWPQHVHHQLAHQWFSKIGRKSWATCPLTQLAFVRISSNPKIIPEAASVPEAVATLRQIVAQPGHAFWPDAVSLEEKLPVFSTVALVGHRQVTDAYLIALALHNGGMLATLDRGVPELISDAKARAQLVAVLTV